MVCSDSTRDQQVETSVCRINSYGSSANAVVPKFVGAVTQIKVAIVLLPSKNFRIAGRTFLLQ